MSSAGPSSDPLPAAAPAARPGDPAPLSATRTAPGQSVAGAGASSSSQFLTSPASIPTAGGSSSSARTPHSQLSPRTPASTSVTTHHTVLHPNLPSPSSPQQTSQARAALVGTISNLLDAELQGRAGLLHQNAKALEGQERDVVKATEALRRENDKLVKVVKEGSKKVLETGNVQNWAEVLERDFLVLEDTLRRVRGGSDGGCSDPDCSGCSYDSGSWSGSVTPSRRGSLDAERFAGAAMTDGKGKAVEDMVVSDAASEPDEMDMDQMMAPGPGDSVGSFALVNNAIAASISEAMATSIDDAADELSADGTDESKRKPSLDPASPRTVGEDSTRNQASVVELIHDRTLNNSEMDLDDLAKGSITISADPTDQDLDPLERVGLAPEAEHWNSSSTTNILTPANETESIGHVQEVKEVSEQPTNGEAMDVDIPVVETEATIESRPLHDGGVVQTQGEITDSATHAMVT